MGICYMEQASFNLMAAAPSAVILEPPKIKSATIPIVSPSICHEVIGPDAMILIFWVLSFKPVYYYYYFLLSSFTFFERFFSFSLLSDIRVVPSSHLRLLIFLLTVLIPARASSRPAFHMMYATYKLNKQGDNIQPWSTLFQIWNQSVFLCLVLILTSWPAYSLNRRQVKWPCIPISWRIFHNLSWSTQSKALACSIKQK